ncbi:major facilitator superfamily domain-containing protein [Zychaea mexicana]|uniref:major facilitator superfamily domain-containing protein n=1 Tax=Zychaea mexicana TaxID=64656 RepID=UPI0022FDFDA4|nr:major facilitator superfamily domain-containing protein [Zychaea mexicana]KAI9497363.1 major facilitator superfamily domain-containing protein [Zychaea mexicana]
MKDNAVENQIEEGHYKISTTSADIDDHDANSIKGSGKTRKFVYTPDEKRLLRKINFATVPFICAIVFLQYLDKVALNFSAVMGLYEDTNLNGAEFSWLGSVFYLGYLLFQVPGQYFIQRFPMSKYLGTCLVLWGAVLACTALATNFSQLMVLRFLQGFFEASAYPCIQLLISTIYRRSEQVILFGILMMSNNFGISIGGLIGFGFLNLDGVHGLSGWRWCMIILGSATGIVGILTFIFLPDTAKSRWYRLTPKEVSIVQDRMRDNKVVQNKVIKFDHIWEALRESRFYCYVLICYLVHIINGCTSIFSTSIIKDMGFSNMESILLNIPSGFSAMILVLITVYCSRRFNENNYVGALACVVSFTGVLLLTVLPRGGAMLAGIFLVTTNPASAIVLSVISNNVNGYTKKVFYNAAYLVAYCLGNFTGPLMMRPEQAPRYLGGMSGFMTAALASAVLFLYGRWTYVSDNRYRRHLKATEKLPSPIESGELVDLTDRQNLEFLYRP